MREKLSQKLKSQIQRIIDRLRITNFLRMVYFKLAPYGTQRYKLSRKLLRHILNNFRLLNIRYQYWIKHFDTLKEKDLQQYHEKIEVMPRKPLLSVIMPVFNPNVKYLEEAIISVRKQIYPQWELCIADDASTKPGVRELIKKYVESDQRIKAVFREHNGHISAASNSALRLASGEFIVLLDHDDILHPLSLYYVASEITSYPEVAVIYSDEDKLTARGKRIDPYFKSDFDYELLLCQNMVSHLGAYKTSTVHKVGGFRIGLEGSQDYDLLLRVIEQIEHHQIRHIPKMLYHWRISKQSVSTSTDIKPYALEAGVRALQDHLSNQEIDAEINNYGKYGFNIKYAEPQTEPHMACFIKSDQISDQLIQSIDSLFENTDFKDLRLYIITDQNQLNHQALEILQKINPTKIDLISNVGPLDYHQVINSTINQINADYLGFIDPACLSFSDRWLENLISIARNPEIGMVSPRLVYKNALIHSCGVVLGADAVANHLFNGAPQIGPDFYFGWAHLNKGYSALPTGCLLIKRSAFQMVGGFDFDYQNENACIIDFCLKIREHGLRNIMTPSVNVVVNQDQTQANLYSNGELILIENDKDLLYKRWKNYFTNDPSFNPNLTIYHGKPMVSKSPRGSNLKASE